MGRPFNFLKSRGTRERFMDDLSGTLAAAPFTLIAGAINKARLKQRYSVPDNPYSLALKFCMERVHGFLADQEQAGSDIHFLVEKRGKNEDEQVSNAFRRICAGDNRRGKLPNFAVEFVDKRTNLPGLQIADLVSTPIGRHLLRPDQHNRAFEVVRSKFRRSPDGCPKGWGFKVFP